MLVWPGFPPVCSFCALSGAPCGNYVVCTLRPGAGCLPRALCISLLCLHGSRSVEVVTSGERGAPFRVLRVVTKWSASCVSEQGAGRTLRIFSVATTHPSFARVRRVTPRAPASCNPSTPRSDTGA